MTGLLYVILGLVVGAWTAYTIETDPYALLPQPALSVFAMLLWPLAAMMLLFTYIGEAGKRREQRRVKAAEERARQLAIAEAALNRDGFYGDVVKANQLRYDGRGAGLYRHALTQEGA